ncbi:MAG: DDE-type integrase/transposase/recombinase [Nitrososphaeraceae archaeon]
MVDREQLGQVIAQTFRAVRRVNAIHYRVQSQSDNGKYVVRHTNIGWNCTCSDHRFRGVRCKHIYAVEFSFAIRETVQQEVVIQPISQLVCRYCNSEHIVKKAIRRNKQYDIQRYLCKDCGKRFSFNIGFEKMRAPADAITSAMQLYFTGESFRNVMRFLELCGVHVSHVAVYKWIEKYVTLMRSYAEKIKLPALGNAWRTDELYVKFRGDMKYMYAIMDDETRFWIAQQVSGTKYTADVRPLFQKAKQVAGKRPSVLISDGAPNYNQAFKDEFFRRKPRSRHIRHIRLQGDHNNNKMERMNGEVRDREKVMRGLKNVDTSVLPGYQMYHNYFRPHEGIGNVTPAEKCGIKIEGENKWMTVIQNAKREQVKA